MRVDVNKQMETVYGGGSVKSAATMNKFKLSLNWETAGLYVFRTGSSSIRKTVRSVLNAHASILLFAWPFSDDYNAIARVFEFSVSNGQILATQLVPSVDEKGIPCMFDLVSKQPIYNSGTGQFIAGFTLAQAAQLGRKLPNTGGSLTLSLPEGFDMDERVVNSLAEAEAKGWVLTIQTYAAAETAAATFALRRVWVRREQYEYGSYVAADGSRWLVEWCVDVIGADPASLGYERFRSVDAAVAYWELEPYIDPNAEELLTVEEQS